ncbi:winged helix domain-containing protein, partial [Vibrio sp. 10N.222.55.E8]
LWTEEEIIQHLESEGEIHRVSGLKALYHEGDSNTAFINGEVVNVEKADASLLNVLCDDTVLNSATLLTSSGVTIVTDLVNKGYWFIED